MTGALSDYVERARQLGFETFALATHWPVLVGAVDESDAGGSFHTVFADDPRSLSSNSPLLPPSASVFPLRKRPGGPFAEQIGIGRARNTDVCIASPHVSKYHAFVTRAPSGGWAITDAGSANGTSIDGEWLEPKIARDLLDGCVVSFGPHRLQFLLPESLWQLVRRLLEG